MFFNISSEQKTQRILRAIATRLVPNGAYKAAKAYFDELGDRFLEKSTVWPSKESFVHYRKWARTGRWQVIKSGADYLHPIALPEKGGVDADAFFVVPADK